MGNQVFSNNASALLAASITDVETVIQVDAGFGALFPSPGASEFFQVVLENASGDLEICQCTERTGDLLTVVRAQEGTTAQAFVLLVTRVELRNTAGTQQQFIQRGGDDMQGPLEMGGNPINEPEITNGVMTGGQTVGTAIRGTLDDSSNEISVPDDGTRALASGSPIVTLDDDLMTLMPIGAIILWFTGLGSLPTDWQICDGTNGSPDLQDQFVRGAGGAFALGDTGGAETAAGSTSSDGGHTHTGSASGPHTLTIAELPAHHHRLLDRGTTGNGIADGSSLSVCEGLSGTRATNQFSAPYKLKGTSQGVNQNFVEDTGGGNSHTHAGGTINAVGDHSHTLASVAIIPPFTAVYYVMKVA
ncbi:MAG: hypothetical protein KAJ55_08970 [Anaerolineales bacterium]|nr:hypothetical protein [Anaerolineales bacterium]